MIYNRFTTAVLALSIFQASSIASAASIGTGNPEWTDHGSKPLAPISILELQDSNTTWILGELMGVVAAAGQGWWSQADQLALIWGNELARASANAAAISKVIPPAVPGLDAAALCDACEMFQWCTCTAVDEDAAVDPVLQAQKTALLAKQKDGLEKRSFIIMGSAAIISTIFTFMLHEP